MRSSRRRLLGILGGALAAALSGAPLCQPGSRGAYYRIGVITGESRFTRELVEGLRELGYEEGRHYALAVRSYGAEGARLGALADELIALQPDVIVASAAGPAAALKSRTRRIPIVMASALDPVGDGLVSSLAQPGGNLTGMTMLNAAVRVTPTHLVALAVLGEPIGSSLITWAAFGEQPPIHAVLGGAIVIAGIGVGFVKRR